MPAQRTAQYITGGATTTSLERFPTKRALKGLIKEHPLKVRFYTTSLFGPQFDGNIVQALQKWPGNVLQITGPNPENGRNWYANVKLNRNNEIVCD